MTFQAQFDAPLLTPKKEEEELLEKQQEDSLVARMKMFVQLRQDLERVIETSLFQSRRGWTMSLDYGEDGGGLSVIRLWRRWRKGGIICQIMEKMEGGWGDYLSVDYGEEGEGGICH